MARGRPAKCPYCGGKSINKGYRKTKTLGKRRIKLCKACGRKFTPANQPRPVEPEPAVTEPAEQQQGVSGEPQEDEEAVETPTEDEWSPDPGPLA